MFVFFFLLDVSMSARALIQLFRTLDPKMLQKKFRVSHDFVYHIGGELRVAQACTTFLNLEHGTDAAPK